MKSLEEKTRKSGLYNLVQQYTRNRDEETGQEILELLTRTAQNTFRFLLNKSFSSTVHHDFILRQEAVIAASNACWIAITDENFLKEFDRWREKNSASGKSSLQNKDENQLFIHYLSNLAARTIYRLTRDEFSELYSMFSRNRTIQYLEDLKYQVADTQFFNHGIRGESAVEGNTRAGEETGPLLDMLDRENSFIMKAYIMIKNSDHRDVVSRYDMSGVSLKEIAREKNLAHEVIRQWHRRGLTELKRNLDQILCDTMSSSYTEALEKIRASYGQLEEPYRLRLKLLEMNTGGLSVKESLERLTADGILPEAGQVELLVDTRDFERVIDSIKDFPFMDERLLKDSHFRDSLYSELKRGKSKDYNVEYIFTQILKFHLQQSLWALYETIKEIAEKSGAGHADSPGHGHCRCEERIDECRT